MNLSLKEFEQLGTVNGNGLQFVDFNQWIKLRQTLVEKSIKTNPLLKNLEMIAYTPGETLELLKHPEVQDWHERMSKFKVDDKYETLILVPCAKTKPWDENHSKKSQLYNSYNNLIRLSNEGKISTIYFVTISEPLGIIPQEYWSSFPQYDNPGLFKDDFLRLGFKKKDWVNEFGERRMVPFDKNCYEQTILKLGKVLSLFLKNNLNKTFLSFVDNLNGQSVSTHSDILDAALKNLPKNKINLKRYTKRALPREAPYFHILSKIQQLD